MTQNQITSNCMEPKLKANPFNAYRDTNTGEWKVVLLPQNSKPQSQGNTIHH